MNVKQLERLKKRPQSKIKAQSQQVIPDTNALLSNIG